MEKQNGVSDDEMARHYLKYIKPSQRVVEPPEVDNPVRLRDPTRSSEVGGKSKLKRPMSAPGKSSKKFKR